MDKEVAVIIPIYQADISQSEKRNLLQSLNIFKLRSIIMLCPESLDIANYLALDKNLVFMRIDDGWFKGIAAYNNLMLSPEFYQLFVEYKYILICQLDVFVFRDDLSIWMQSGYDYIGAPWIKRSLFLAQYIGIKQGVFSLFKAFCTRSFSATVGNGGFSLRKIQAFQAALSQETNKKWKINEDFYWSFFAKTKSGLFRLPPAYDAAKFCIELEPRFLVKKIGGLPMAIHAWERYDKSFWLPYVEEHFKANQLS